MHGKSMNMKVTYCNSTTCFKFSKREGGGPVTDIRLSRLLFQSMIQDITRIHDNTKDGIISLKLVKRIILSSVYLCESKTGRRF